MNKKENGNVAEEQYATATDRHLVDATPNPRLLESLRDMGYDNYQAICDIIDNSVDAVVINGTKKPEITITTKFGSDGKGRICIIDNGIGMTEKILTEALKLGSETSKIRDGELGYFGVGLNSASISLGRGFKIITKHSDDDHMCGIFDLDIAIKEKSWKFVSIEKANQDEVKYFKQMLGNSTGTILEIYKLDRISNRNKTQFDNQLLKAIGKTYRSYISGKNGVKKISFVLNDTKVEMIDPMGVDLKGTMVLNNNITDQKYQFNVDVQLAEIVVRYYYVDSALETKYPTETLNGRNNGFYVMRNHRQIMEAERFDFTGVDKYSGWLSNFRAELLFDGKFDEVFKTNVMKNRIILPQSLTDLMQPDVSEAVKFCKLEKKKTMPESAEEVDEDVLKDVKSIVKQKNENKKTPTLLTDKNGNPIKKEKIEGVEDEPEVEDKEKRDRKKEEKPRNKKTFNKIDVDFVRFGEDASFFMAHHQGNGKFLIRINIDHRFYQDFARLDRQGRKFLIDLLHSFALASRQELYSDDLTQIDELIRTWSNFLRRDLNGKE